MSTDDREFSAHSELSAHSRRLRLRNSLVRPSRLSYGSSSGVVSPPRRFSVIDDDGWQTEDPEAPPEDPSSTSCISPSSSSSAAARKRRNRNSSGSALSCASTLLNTPEPPERGDRDEFLFPGLERAMTSPSPGSRDKPFGLHHRRNRSGSEGGGAGSARYVDYLERQVADLLAQVQAYTTPATGTSHATKMRRLSNEARSLRAELNDWEAKFNIRVADEVAVRAAQDATLRGKIAALEERLETTEDRGRYAEEELEEARVRLQEMEEENGVLERRIETLSALMAEAAARSRPASVHAESRRPSLDAAAVAAGSSPGGMSDYGISDPIEHALSTLCSSDPPTSFHAVPLTPISPLPPSDTLQHTLRSRRMRRFPSGSSAPKTLILPSVSVPASPTLPTIRTFFGTAVADPGSMRAPSLPLPPASLFAELARAQDSDDQDDDGEEEEEEEERVPLTPMVKEAVGNPTPLLVRAITGVGRGIVTQGGGTLLSARRRAMIMLTGAVGGGVTRRRGKVVVRRKGGQCECGCIEHAPSVPALVPVRQQHHYQEQGGQMVLAQDDPVENVWLWVRFVVAIVVALGVAVREGPGVVMGDTAGEEFDSVGEEEREGAIRKLGAGRVYGIGSLSVGWEGHGRSGSGGGGGGGGVHVGEGRRKGLEWGV